jgi:hypothetical protein
MLVSRSMAFVTLSSSRNGQMAALSLGSTGFHGSTLLLAERSIESDLPLVSTAVVEGVLKRRGTIIGSSKGWNME